jgi:hypothetical protein
VLGIVDDDTQKKMSVDTITATTGGFLLYENPTYGMKIQYPDDWEKKEPTPYEVLFRFPTLENTSDTSSKYLLVVANTFDPQENMTLDTLTHDQIDFLKESFSDLTLNESESNVTTLAGNPAYKVTFDHRNGAQQGDPDYKLIQIWTIKGDRAYFITYRTELEGSSDNYLQTIQKMIDSFEISNFLLYENPTLGIKIQYPADWEEINGQADSKVTFISPLQSNLDMYRDNVMITIKSLSKNMTLDEYARMFISGLKNNATDFKIIEEGPTTLVANNTAYKIIFTTKDRQYDLKVMTVLTINDDKVHLIEYRSEQESYFKYLVTAQKMIDSFEIKTGSLSGSFFGLVIPAPLLGIPSPILPPLGFAVVPSSPTLSSPPQDDERGSLVA